MQTDPLAVSAPANNTHWPSVWQFGLSLFGILALWGIAAAMLLSFVNSALNGDSLGALTVLLNSTGIAFAGLLLIPSTGYALFRLMGKPATFKIRRRYLQWGILALPPVLILGYLATLSVATSYLFLPVLHILATVLSVGWLLSLGLRGLSAGSPQLSWGIFNSGLVGTPLLSLVTELAALLVLGVLGVIYLSQDPALIESLYELSQTLPANAPERALELLQPYLGPGTLYIALFFGALLVPILEEMFKPIGVWLLVGRHPSPSQGFAAGLLSGAGYALFENFLLGASAGQDWAMVVVARMGTSLIHITTTGLMGWALTLAWSEKRYLRLVFIYFVAIAIHGAWNGTVILTAVSGLFADAVAIPDFLVVLGNAAPAIFALVILGCLLLLFGFNAALRRTQPSPVGDVIIPPASPSPAAEILSEKDPI